MKAWMKVPPVTLGLFQSHVHYTDSPGIKLCNQHSLLNQSLTVINSGKIRLPYNQHEKVDFKGKQKTNIFLSK